ncbi:Cro/CI family transcriptional regulator [Klebsiella quasipneumoniae]|uniref:Cro/CI family transcriptional regulator n=1 Tax=Klebsiella quasipneumoniae TaxID=1463165 RepID=UPI001886CA97|nr:Cro/CI family transcriptional regulator [Klebsiella quasipneumoniae]
MKKLTLKEFADQEGQVKAASKLGIRQSAISKALRLKRNIFVLVHPDGTTEAEEVKPFNKEERISDSRGVTCHPKTSFASTLLRR